jgi:hypothetical protein
MSDAREPSSVHDSLPVIPRYTTMKLSEATYYDSESREQLKVAHDQHTLRVLESLYDVEVWMGSPQ